VFFVVPLEAPVTMASLPSSGLFGLRAIAAVESTLKTSGRDMVVGLVFSGTWSR
jgi:hypothetical protein